MLAEISIGFLANSYGDDFMQWKWRLYDEQIKRKFWTRLGVRKIQPPHGDHLQGRG
jgi:hypothetical protein